MEARGTDSGGDLAEDKVSGDKRQKAVRVLAIKNMATICGLPFSSDPVGPFVADIMEVLRPKIDALDREVLQSPSGVMALFLAWSSNAKTISYLNDIKLLSKLIGITTARNVKPKVVKMVLNIFQNLSECEEAGAQVLMSVAGGLVHSIYAILNNEQFQDTATFKQCLQLISYAITALDLGHEESMVALSLLLQLMTSKGKSNSAVFIRSSPGNRREILEMSCSLIGVLIDDADARQKFMDKHFDSLFSLFSTVDENTSRQALCEALGAIARQVEDFQSSQRHHR